MSSVTGPQDSSPLPSDSGVPSQGLTPEEKARPFYSMLKCVFPLEPDGSFSPLTESECTHVVNWVASKSYFSRLFGKKVVKQFKSLKPDYIRQQFDRILAEKNIALDKIDSEKKIKEIVFDVFWHMAKDEIKNYIQDDKLKEEVGEELKIPSQSTVVKRIIEKYSGKIEFDACWQIANWCLCDRIDDIEKIIQEKVKIKLSLSLIDIYLKEMLVVDKEY